jgi:hypothetical protein
MYASFDFLCRNKYVSLYALPIFLALLYNYSASLEGKKNEVLQVYMAKLRSTIQSFMTMPYTGTKELAANGCFAIVTVSFLFEWGRHDLDSNYACNGVSIFLTNMNKFCIYVYRLVLSVQFSIVY